MVQKKFAQCSTVIATRTSGLEAASISPSFGNSQEIFRLFLGSGFSPRGHARSMARGAGKNDRHSLLQSCQSFGVILVGNFVRQGEGPKQ